METKEDQFSATSSNPVLRVDKDSTILYSNEAGKTLLNEWEVGVGEKLPSNIGHLVKKVILQNNPEKMEFNVGKSVYLTVFHPLYEEKCVFISGFDISCQKGFGEKVQESEAKSLSKCDILLKALRESEEEYLNLIETTNEGIFLTSDEAILTYVNLRTAEMLGYSQEEIIGRVVWDFVGEVSKESARLHLEKRLQGINESYELTLTRKDGSSLLTHINSRSLIDKNGKFLGSLSMIIDITECKQAEKALQESETRFRTLAENSPDIITRFDRQHRHIYVNPAAVDSYGISLDKIIGKTQGELGRDSKKAKFWQKHLENTFITGTTKTLEYNYISPQGKKLYFNTKIVPEFADGKIISAFSISRDITDIREAEAKLKETLENLEKLIEKRTTELEKAYNSLKESEEGLSEAQKMAHIGNWVWDIAADKAYWSDELYHIFGRDPQQSAPTYNEYLNYLHHDERDYVADTFKKALTRKSSSIDHRIVLPNGKERTVHIQSEVICDEENIPFRIKGIVQDITERKKAEEKIRSLASIVESSSDAIITMSLDNIITSWNKGAEQNYGYSAAEVLGKCVSILVPSHLDEEGKRLTEKIKQGDRIQQYETSSVRKDGKIIDISLNLSPIVDDSGRLTAISVIARDITERKRVEEKLRESEEKYRNIVETANEGISLVSPEGFITYVNKKMADMLGYTVEEGNGRPIFDFLSEKSLDIVKLNMEKRLKGIDSSYESQLVRKDGSLIWVHVNAKSLSGKSGEFIGTLTMLTDITESKRAEIALKENESRFRNLFEVITSGVAIFDVIDHGSDFIFKDMNPACERTFHVQREDIIGKNLYNIFPCANKMGLEAAFRWVWLAGQQEFIPPVFYEDRNITLWLTTNIFRLPSGELVAVFEDITERKQAYEEREQLLEYIQQEKDRLFALVNSITDEVWFTDTKKNFTLVNPSALNEFNIMDEDKVKMDKLVVSLEIYKPDGSLRPIEEDPSLRALKGEIVKNQDEIVLSPIYGELRYRQVSASPVHDTGGNIIGSVSVVRDITENKRAEAALQKSEEQYRTLFNTMNEGFSIIEMLFDENKNPIDYIFVETNPAFEKQTGLSNVVGKRMRELIPAIEEYWYEIYGKVALTGEAVRFENPIEALNRWYEVYTYHIGLPTSRKVAVIFNDITERKKAEDALKESEEKYRNIVETANEGISIISAEAKIIYSNKKMDELLGYSQEECIGKPIWDFISEEFIADVKLNLERRRQGVSESIEIKLRRKDGLPIWVNINSKSIFDKTGAFIGSMNMLTDTTKRKEAEESLANIEIARKKEIHHRIKNNLQVISSLLDLQAEKFKGRENIKDSEVLEAFRESQDRVISMALLHEELYKGGGFETLNFSAYIEELAYNLLYTYRLGNTEISIIRDLEGDLVLDMDIAIPLGIIINELVTNSFKHAFPRRDRGKIRIKLYREGKGDFINVKGESKYEDCKRTNLVLSVSDNGVGIPENFDIENLESLGLLLVTSLVDQLDGEYEIKRKRGTEFIIRFSVKVKNNQASVPVPINYNESPKIHQ